MSALPTPKLDYSNIQRAAINRANSEHSTGPRTDAGKERSSRNSLRHGLTARSAVLPSEDRDTFDQHCRQFLEEYQPTTATETHLVQELADTSWRLRRVPLLEAHILTEATSREQHANPLPTIHALANLGLHGARLSRQFHKTLDQLRKIQAARRDLKTTAMLENHKNKGFSADPSDNGFVFSTSDGAPRVSKGTESCAATSSHTHAPRSASLPPDAPHPTTHVLPTHQSIDCRN